MLKDKSVDTEVFSLLRKMKPLRQIEAIEDRPLCPGAAGGDAAGGPRPTGSLEEHPRSDGRADGPHGA